MASAESNHVDHVVELMERDRSASSGDAEEQTTPLLIQAEVPKINIFTASYPRRKPRDEETKSLESETSSITQFILWVWSGCRYSGLLCMTLSSTIYFLMEVLSSNFSAITSGIAYCLIRARAKASNMLVQAFHPRGGMNWVIPEISLCISKLEEYLKQLRAKRNITEVYTGSYTGSAITTLTYVQSSERL